jgi:hypothetical protein
MTVSESTSSRGTEGRDIGWAIAVAAACVVMAIVLPTRADPDLWGHIRFGLDVLHSRTLPAIDVYSWTQDQPQLYHEWLGAVFLGAAYGIAGSSGVLALKAVLAIAIFATFIAPLRRMHPLVAAAVLLLVAIDAAALTSSVRPQLWTLLGLLCMVRLLEAGRFGYVPFLFVPWASLHGGWVMGLGVLGAWCAATGVDRYWRTRRIPWLLVALPLLAFGATILTPYGWQLWRFLGATVGLSRTDISDWQPLSTKPLVLWVPVIITITLLVAVVVRQRARGMWPTLFVIAVLLYGSVRITRVSLVAMPVIVLLITPSLANWRPRDAWTFRAPSAAAARLTLIPIAAVIIATLMTVAPSLNCIPMIGKGVADAAAIPVLAGGIDGGRIVTWFDWGEYALWHLGPRLKVSMDGRRETLYSPRILAIHYSIYDGTEKGSAWLADQRPEYVWLKTSQGVRRDWLAAHGYRIDWQSNLSWIAVRADLPRLSGPPTMASSGCFPGP